MRIKDETVHFGEVRQPMAGVLLTIADIFEDELGYAIITSAVDGRHSFKSAHYRGDATDWRTWTSEDSGEQIPWAHKEIIVRRLQEKLGPAYDVVPEATHIHVEFDPKTLDEWETILT